MERAVVTCASDTSYMRGMKTRTIILRKEQLQQFKLPREIFEVDPRDFARKLMIFGLAVVSSSVTISYSSTLIATILAQIVQGMLFAHGVELVHECLHDLAFRNKKLNLWVGRVLGLPMFVPFTEYLAKHLEHHKWLGTPKDTEFFSYNHKTIKSWPGLLLRAYSLKRYCDVLRKIIDALRGRPNSSGRNPREVRYIQQEYRFMAVLMGCDGPLLLGLSESSVHQAVADPAHHQCGSRTLRYGVA